MIKPLNERLTVLYNNLDVLNRELRNRIANLDDISNFTIDLVSDLVDKRRNILKAAGKFKSEADKNFLLFVQKAMENATSAEDYKAIRRLLELKNLTTDKEKVVIIDDIICVNASMEDEARELLGFLNQREEVLDLPDLKEPEVLEVGPTFDEMMALNNSLKEKLESEIVRISGKTTDKDIITKYTDSAIDGKEISTKYLREYNRLLEALKLLKFGDIEDLEKVLDMVYLPRRLKETFISIMAKTNFYHRNYDSLLINKDIREELISYLNSVDNSEEQEDIKAIINLLSAKNKLLTRVWNIGYVPQRDISKFQDLVLKVPYLRDKLNIVNKEMLISILEELKEIKDNLPLRESLMNKYQILKRGIDTKSAVINSDGARIPKRDEKNYLNLLNEIEVKKKNGIINYEQLGEGLEHERAQKEYFNGLLRNALETIKNKLTKKDKNYSLQRVRVSERFSTPLALPAPKKDISMQDIETVLASALNTSPDMREKALDVAINQILGRNLVNGETDKIIEEARSYPAVEPVTTDLPKRALAVYQSPQEELDDFVGKMLRENNALASEENLNRTVSQILDTITGGVSTELNKLLEETKILLEKSPTGLVRSKDSQVLLVDIPETSKEVSRVKRTRKWFDFRNMKIFCSSLMAASYADDYRLGTNPYVNRLTKLVDNIVLRCKQALQDEQIRDKYFDYHYYSVKVNDTRELTEAINSNPEDMNLNIGDYDTVLITGILKSEKLIKEANLKIQELTKYIVDGTKARYQFEFIRIEQLREQIKNAEDDIRDAKEHHAPDSEAIIYDREDLIAKLRREIKETEQYIDEHSRELYVSEYARINVLNSSIACLREKQALAQVKLYEHAKMQNDTGKAKEYRDSVMRMTSLDLAKYFDLASARSDIKELMSRDNDELVSQMKYVISSLDDLLKDTRTFPEIKQIGDDINGLSSTVDMLNQNEVRLFK